MFGIDSRNKIRQTETHYQAWCPRCKMTTVHSRLEVLYPGRTVMLVVEQCLKCHLGHTDEEK